MFDGLDLIDWASMGHAYGSAEDVPAMIRGLVSPSPEERERALDGMLGAVHHQGDVYECTVAAVPFLIEALAHPELPGRADVADLLASIGGAPEEGSRPTRDVAPADERIREVMDAQLAAVVHEMAQQRDRACDLLHGERPFLTALLDDDEAVVRRSAVRALLAAGDDARTPRLLRDRYDVETEGPVRRAILWALATLARRGHESEETGRWIEERSRADADPVLRLLALIERMHDTPGPLSEGAVDAARAALDEAHRVEPEAALLMHDVSRAMGDQVDARAALLASFVGSTDPGLSGVALGPLSRAIAQYRGDHRDVAGLLGRQFFRADLRSFGTIADTLASMFELAAPAVDGLLHSLESAPREGARPFSDEGHPPWITRSGEGASCGPTLRALARTGDRRALPMLRWALERSDMPRDAGFLLRESGHMTAELIPLVRRRLRDLPAVEHHDARRFGLLAALRTLGPAAAPALPELLSLASREGSVRVPTLAAIGALGPRGLPAVEVLSELLDHPSDGVAFAAATSLWEIERDAGRVVVVFAHLLSKDQHALRDGLDGVALLGPAAAAYLPRVREVLASVTHPYWDATHAAMALWRIAGDTDAIWPALRTAWERNAVTRRAIASFLVTMGAHAAPMRPELEAEVARVRRHTSSDFASGSHDVHNDEALLRHCHEALAGCAR